MWVPFMIRGHHFSFTLPLPSSPAGGDFPLPSLEGSRTEAEKLASRPLPSRGPWPAGSPDPSQEPHRGRTLLHLNISTSMSNGHVNVIKNAGKLIALL